MKLTCRYENRDTGEQRDQICTLDPDEIARVEDARRTVGDEAAMVLAAAIALHSAYSTELDALEWHHLGPPALMN
jgi:hypothetical protein